MEGNSGGTGGGGGNDVELLCKTLQVEHKLFYFDLKENPRGRYLKISEKTSATRSTIIVPFDGISWFLDLFNYYVNSDKQDVFSKELQLDSKADTPFFNNSFSLLCYFMSHFPYFIFPDSLQCLFVGVLLRCWRKQEGTLSQGYFLSSGPPFLFLLHVIFLSSHPLFFFSRG